MNLVACLLLFAFQMDASSSSTTTSDRLCFDLIVTVYNTDWGSENSVFLQDDEGIVVMEWDYPDDDTEYRYAVYCLDIGRRWTVVFEDSYGDGWHGGTVTLEINGEWVFSTSPEGYGSHIRIDGSDATCILSSECIWPYVGSVRQESYGEQEYNGGSDFSVWVLILCLALPGFLCWCICICCKAKRRADLEAKEKRQARTHAAANAKRIELPAIQPQPPLFGSEAAPHNAAAANPNMAAQFNDAAVVNAQPQNVAVYPPAANIQNVAVYPLAANIAYPQAAAPYSTDVYSHTAAQPYNGAAINPNMAAQPYNGAAVNEQPYYMAYPQAADPNNNAAVNPNMAAQPYNGAVAIEQPYYPGAYNGQYGGGDTQYGLPPAYNDDPAPPTYG